jgi:FKBP-type peptidyl-prolyl cis-trans isomerase SlyD
MEAARGTVVSFNYHLTDDEGSTLDQSDEPLDYLHGYGNIIPGLESALEGTKPGDQRTVVVEPADAYGEYDPEQVTTLRRDAADQDMDLQPGMMVMAETEDGSMPLTIREVTDDEIVVDGNHPLAGQRLHFDVEIVSVRTATAQELEQGYPGE